MSAPAKTQTLSAETIAWGAILVAVFMTPLAMTDFGWLGIEQPLTADIYTEAKVFVLRISALVALAAWSWSVLVDGRPLRRTAFDPWVLAFVGWLGVSTAFSIQPLTSLFGYYTRSEGLLTYVLYAALFFLTVQLVDSGSRVRALAKAVFWSGAVVSAYGVAQYLGLDWVRDVPEFLIGRAYSTLGNPMILGGYLIFVLPVSAALALTERRSGWRVAYWAGALLSAVALMATFSRSAWIGAAVAVALLVGYVVYQRVGIERRIDMPFAGVALATLGLAALRSMGSADGVTNLSARLGELLDFEAGSGFSRVGLWSAAAQATMDRPLAGFGPDTFRLFSTGYLAPEYARAGDYLAIPDNAHSYPFQLISTAGVPGLLLFAGLVGAVGWISARRVLLVPRGSGKSGHVMLAAFWVASAGHVVNLLASISMPNTTFLLWVSMAALVSPLARELPAREIASARVLASAAAVACLVLAAASTLPLLGDRQYLVSLTTPDQQTRLDAADASVRLSPYYDTYRTSRAILYADVVAAGLGVPGGFDGPSGPQIRAAYQSALDGLEAAREFSPWEQNNYNVLAVVYNLGGRLDPTYYDGAIQTAERGLERFLHAPELRLQYAIALEAVGRTPEAREQLETLVALEPRMAEGAVQLARLYQAAGEVEQAEELLRVAETTVLEKGLVTNALGSLVRGEPIPAVSY